MTFSQGFRLSAVYLGVVGLLILLHSLGWLSSVEKILRGLIEPSSRAIYLGGTEKSIPVASCTTEVSKEVRLAVLEQENAELKTLLGFSETVTSTGPILGSIIGKNLDPIGSTLIAVSRDPRLEHIVSGDPVIAGDGIFVGKVIRREDEAIIIRVLNDPQSRVGGSVLGAPKSMGVVEGGFGNSLRLNLIPQQEPVRVHDRIVTSGIEEQIPFGLLIGTVSAVETEPYQPFQSAIVTPAYLLERIEHVLILASGAS